MLFTSLWLAMLKNCNCDRAVPAVSSRTALRLRVFIYDVNCDAGLLAELGQVVLIARKLQDKRWHCASMQRRRSFGL